MAARLVVWCNKIGQPQYFIESSSVLGRPIFPNFLVVTKFDFLNLPFWVWQAPTLYVYTLAWELLSQLPSKHIGKCWVHLFSEDVLDVLCINNIAIMFWLFQIYNWTCMASRFAHFTSPGLISIKICWHSLNNQLHYHCPWLNGCNASKYLQYYLQKLKQQTKLFYVF